jgi:hypothetical protein
LFGGSSVGPDVTDSVFRGDIEMTCVRVVGITNTTTIRAAGRSLINTVPIAVTSIDDAVAMLRAGQADAFDSDVIRCRRSSRNSPARTSSMELSAFFDATTVVHENLGACRSQRKRAGAPHTARSACDEGGFS